MPDYSQGKIYQLINPETNDIYIGATVLVLSKRMNKHKDLQQQGYKTIHLIEEYPCKTKEELENRKMYHINNKKNIIESNKKLIIEIDEYDIPSDKKYIIYQDDTKYIILHENNKCEVIAKSDLNESIPDNVIVIPTRGLKSAIKGYIYDIERKKKSYQQKKQKRKEEEKKETTT